MKRVLKFMLMATLLMVLSAGVAGALPYSSTLSPNATLSGAGSQIHLAFTPVTPGSYFTDATVDISLNAVQLGTTISWLLDYRPNFGWPLTPPIQVPQGTTNLHAILTGTSTSLTTTVNGVTAPYMFVANNSGLLQLNNALIGPNGEIGTGVVLGGGGATVLSASLTGNVAPEPATMALMGAGIAGLPFVRRFRKKGSDQE